MLLYFNLDRGFEVFLKIADYSGLGGGSNSTKLYQDWLKVLKVGGVISNFFQLILRVLFKLTLDIIDKGLRVSKVFLKKGLKIKLRNWSSALVAALVLGLSEADRATEEFGGKEDTIHSYGT